MTEIKNDKPHTCYGKTHVVVYKRHNLNQLNASINCNVMVINSVPFFVESEVPLHWVSTCVSINGLGALVRCNQRIGQPIRGLLCKAQRFVQD